MKQLTLFDPEPLLRLVAHVDTDKGKAKLLGVDKVTVSQWQRGRRAHYDTVDRVTIRLGLHPVLVYGDEWTAELPRPCPACGRPRARRRVCDRCHNKRLWAQKKRAAA